jgi:two-component system NarL family sensor kinase
VRHPQLIRPRGRGDAVALIAALVRVAVVPVALLGQRLTQPPGTDLELLEALFRVGCVYAVAALLVAALGRRPVRLVPFVVADVALLSLLAYAAGGAEAHIRFAFGIPPIVAAFLARPRQTAALAVATVACFGAVVMVAPAVGEPTPARTAAVAVIDLAWRNALVVAMAVLLARREQRIRRLAESRRVLVAGSLRAEDRARRELAYLLHDGVVQSLLSVRQDLGQAARGRHDAIPRAREVLEATVGALRHEIADLHPHQLETVGLSAAIREVARRKARAGGFRADVAVDDDVAGDHDQLLLALARELLQNAARHAQASRVRIDVVRAGATVVLRCADDGRGCADVYPEASLRDGHLGLTACRERVRAVGGTLHVRSAPGRGTIVRAMLPSDRAATVSAFL